MRRGRRVGSRSRPRGRTISGMERALGILLLAGAGQAQDEAAVDFAPLDAALGARAAEGRFAGVVAVGRAGEVLHVGAFGEASVELGVPHAADTRFKLHSLSKPLLATLVLRRPMTLVAFDAE